MMNQISICEALAKWNEMDPFLKQLVTGDEKWVTCYNIVRKRSWSKCDEAAQTVAKPGLTARKVLLCICLMDYSRWFIYGSETVRVTLGSMPIVQPWVRNNGMSGSHNRHKSFPDLVTVDGACLTEDTDA
ncbi:hypothetical protein TNCV_2564851 [Trichonephila clavipes]|nr:hypothetical protein TNCV_2564851 [Trichonephila clavipes]